MQIDPPVHDPLALIRIRPQQLIGGRPAGMLGRGVPLQVPGAEEPLAAIVNRAAPLQPRLPGVVEAERRARLGLTDLQAGDADEDCEQALDLAERPGEGPAERTVRLYSAPPYPNTCSRKYTVKLALRNDCSKDAEVLAFEPGCEEWRDPG